MTTKLELTISRLDWDQIENDGDTVIKYDHAASEDRYCQMVADELSGYVVDVEIDVVLGDGTYMDGYKARWIPATAEYNDVYLETEIEAAISDVYESFAWCIPASGVLSIDNGRTTCTPEEAIAAVAWDVIVNAMDDDIRETTHMAMDQCSDMEYLVAYLKLGSIVIG